MRVFYYPVHEILEYDDLLALTAAGHSVFSYRGTFGRGHDGEFRPDNTDFSYPEASSLCENGITEALSESLFDVAIINNDINWTHRHIDLLGRVPVVFRTIGQSRLIDERYTIDFADKMTIVRYSERESGLLGFAAADEVIYFSKNASEFQPWVGGGPAATFHVDFALRSDRSVPSVPEYERIVAGRDVVLYSRRNDGVSNWRPSNGQSYAETLDIYRTCSAFLHVRDLRPSYTLTLIEAMLAGCPVVAPSVQFVLSGENRNFGEDAGWTPHRYEVDALLADDGFKFTFDTIEEASSLLDMATARNPAMLEAAARVQKRAVAKFSHETIGRQWTALFDRVCAGRASTGRPSADLRQ